MSQEVKVAGSTTQDERVMSAVAHATVVWPAFGLIAPLVIWGTQREKSPFLSFQALQAAAYQFLVLIGALVAGALNVCSFLSMPLTALVSAPFGEGATICLPFLGFSCTFGILFLLMLSWLVYVGYGLFAALSVLQGDDFRYAFLGPRLESCLEQG